MGETWFGHYRLQRSLGCGGTGQVWLARDTVADRDVALKVLAAVHAADPAYRQRFTREARLAAQVRGPHIASVHTFGELDGRLFIDMEFIEGTDLAALLRHTGPMSPGQAVRILSQTATALDAAHRAGLVHRDIKPSNIMVGPNGFVHLIDFGTAHRLDQPAITANGTLVGTLAYMAPERFNGTADARADQYSLACVLYECLTGERPFGNIDSAQQLRAHLMTDPPRAATVNPAVPVALDVVIARGMAKDPNRRWPSAGEMAFDACIAVMGQETATVEITSTDPVPAEIGAAWLGAGSLESSTSELSGRSAVGPDSGAGRAEAGGPAAAFGLAGAQERRSDSGRVTEPYETSEARGVVGTALAAAAVAVLVSVVGVMLFLGRPGGAENDSAAPISKPTLPSVPPPPSPVPVAPSAAPISAQIATVPTAGQPCDPAVDGNTLAGDGTPLACVSGSAGMAAWTPNPPAPHLPNQGTSPQDNSVDRSTEHDSGQANGNGHGNGNGNGKPNDKPSHGKPTKRDK